MMSNIMCGSKSRVLDQDWDKSCCWAEPSPENTHGLAHRERLDVKPGLHHVGSDASITLMTEHDLQLPQATQIREEVLRKIM